jgi:hypothetical protein
MPMVKMQPVECFEVSGLAGIDPVTVYFQDFGQARGRVVLECYGSAWSAYFGAMGGDSTIRSFFLSSDTDYLVCKLGNHVQWQSVKQRKRDDAYLRRVIEAAKLGLAEREP